MPRAVYSTRFLAVSGTPIAETTYTVPAGYVAVVRDISAFMNAGSGGAIELYGPSTSTPFWYAASSSGSNTAPSAEKRVVLQGGESLVALGGGSVFASLVVSGYLLPT